MCAARGARASGRPKTTEQRQADPRLGTLAFAEIALRRRASQGNQTIPWSPGFKASYLSTQASSGSGFGPWENLWPRATKQLSIILPGSNLSKVKMQSNPTNILDDSGAPLQLGSSSQITHKLFLLIRHLEASHLLLGTFLEISLRWRLSGELHLWDSR